MSLLRQGQPDRVGHLAVDDLERSSSRLLAIEPERGTHTRQRSLGSGGVERDLATEEISRVEIAQYDRSIGDRRLLPAPAEANRTRPRPCAVRSDLQHRAFGADDAAATSPHRTDVQSRNEILVLAIARGRPPDRRAVVDRSDIQRRAADVGGDHVAAATDFGGPSEARSADQTRDRPGPDGQHRHVACMIGVDQPARARHDLQRLCIAMFLEVDLECFEVKPHRRPDQ